MLAIKKHRSALSSEAFCLAVDVANGWYELGCPKKIQISYAVAAEFGYTGNDKTYRKCLKELTDNGVLSIIKQNSFCYMVDFSAYNGVSTQV